MPQGQTLFKIEVIEDANRNCKVFFVEGREIAVRPLTPEEVGEYRRIGWIRDEWWQPVPEIPHGDGGPSMRTAGAEGARVWGGEEV